MNSIISDIKKELRANMNGVASAHARQTEDYRVNWGVELPRLAKISDEIVESKAWGGFSEEDSLPALLILFPGLLRL